MAFIIEWSSYHRWPPALLMAPVMTIQRNQQILMHA
jgi:hypothetical protein